MMFFNGLISNRAPVAILVAVLLFISQIASYDRFIVKISMPSPHLIFKEISLVIDPPDSFDNLDFVLLKESKSFYDQTDDTLRILVKNLFFELRTRVFYQHGGYFSGQDMGYNIESIIYANQFDRTSFEVFVSDYSTIVFCDVMKDYDDSKIYGNYQQGFFYADKSYCKQFRGSIELNSLHKFSGDITTVWRVGLLLPNNMWFKI